jgi:hypothetical protein
VSWVAATSKAICPGEGEFFNSRNQVVIRLINLLRMSYEESYAMAFPFDKMVSGVAGFGDDRGHGQNRE